MELYKFIFVFYSLMMSNFTRKLAIKEDVCGRTGIIVPYKTTLSKKHINHCNYCTKPDDE